MTITQVTDRELELRAEIARLRAAGKLALVALENKDGWGSSARYAKERAITALKALAEESSGTEQPGRHREVAFRVCNECETVAHCLKHGCIPKQP